MKKRNVLTCLLFTGILALTSGVFAEDSAYLKELGEKLKVAVNAGEMTAKEAMAKYKAAASGKPNDTATTINGFYIGTRKDDEGQLKAAIIVPSKEKDKRKWPLVTFTGESLTSQFDALDQRSPVAITIDDGQSKKVIIGRDDQRAMKKRGGKGGAAHGTADRRGLARRLV